MTANEMKESLEAQVDILSSFAAPSIPDFQASDFLNQAVRGMLNEFRIRGFERDDYTRRFIAPLKANYVTDSTIDVTDMNHRNGKFFFLPDNLYLILNERAVVDKRSALKGDLLEVKVLPKSEDYILSNQDNPEKKPYVDTSSDEGLIWRLDFAQLNQSNKIAELITDGSFNVIKYKVRYLKYPNKINVNLENPEEQVNSNIYEEFHQEIINMAALIAVENMGLQSRFQTKAPLNLKLNQ